MKTEEAITHLRKYDTTPEIGEAIRTVCHALEAANAELAKVAA